MNMLHLKRSTNERVLARHHALYNRFNPALQSPPADNSDDEPALGVVDFVSNPIVPVAETEPVIPPAQTVGTIATSPQVPPPHVPVVTAVSPVLPLATQAPTVTTTVETTIIAPPTVPVSKPIVSSQSANRGVSATPSHTAIAQSSASPHPVSKSSKGLSSGAVGGIVIVVLLAVFLVIAFFVRKGYQRRRATKRNTWGAGLVPSLDNMRQSMYVTSEQKAGNMSTPGGTLPSEMSQTPAPRVLSVPSALATASATKSPSPYGTPAPSVPASPISPFVPPPIPAPSLRSLAVDSGPVTNGELAVVARTFIPSLPDELHIANGEQIFILSAYDDGWALCANTRGEQGVVPLECLERRKGASGGNGYESNRASRRMSSLTPAAPGTY